MSVTEAEAASRTAANLDERDYREKNNWRRWVWNRICDRLTVKASEATAVYLAAAGNLDAVVAAHKGFAPNNLVAVDNNKQKVRRLRNAGELIICDDVFDVLYSFGRRVDVVNLDFCCGLTLTIMRHLLNLQRLPHTRNAVYALNFLRGRDASSNELRNNFADLMDSKAKHRGIICFFSLMAPVLNRIVSCGYRTELSRDDATDQASIHLTHLLQPAKSSYRSSTVQTFDTVVFLGHGAIDVDFDLEGWNLQAEEMASSAVRAKLAAYRAHQTRRKSAMEL